MLFLRHFIQKPAGWSVFYTLLSERPTIDWQECRSRECNDSRVSVNGGLCGDYSIDSLAQDLRIVCTERLISRENSTSNLRAYINCPTFSAPLTVSRFLKT